MVQKLGKSKIAKHIRKVIHLFHKPKTESATISPRKQKKLNARLLESAENGSSDEEIRRLLKAGADVNAKNENDETALREATEDNYIETCKLLIENGADLNAKDWHTETALMLAAGRGHNEIARMLIEKGADVNAKTRDGNTALMIATRNGRNEIARMLIEKGADVNAKVVENGFYKGRTSLMIAADNKADAYTCKTLVEMGADIYAKDDKGWTAIMIAKKNGSKEKISFLSSIILQRLIGKESTQAFLSSFSECTQ